MSSGSAWPSNDGPNALVLTGVSDGADGIGFFFLRLNHVTRNPAYLGKAKRASAAPSRRTPSRDDIQKNHKTFEAI